MECNERDIRTIAQYLTVAADCLAGSIDYRMPNVTVCTIALGVRSHSDRADEMIESITCMVEELLKAK